MSTPTIEPGRLIKLVAENIMRLTAVDINLPSSPVFIVGGKNGQGKTSLLSCIAIALGGKDELPDDPIHGTEAEGKIVLTFEGLVVKVKLVRSGDKTNRYLVIESTDGAKYSSPQAMLDALTGKLAFDPLAFDELDAKEQVTALLKLVGVDVSKFDTDRKTAYDKRTVENRELARLQAELANTLFHTDAPAQPVKADELNAEFQAAITHNRGIDAQRTEVERAQTSVRVLEEQLQQTIERINRLEAELEEVRSRRAEIENDVKVWTKRTSDLEVALAAAVPADTNALVSKIQELQATNSKVEANAKHAALKDKIALQSTRCDLITGEINAIDQLKREALSKAEFPLDGLTYGDKGITFNGVVLAQASSAERVAISTAIGLSLNPKLKLMIVRNGEKLDEDSLGIMQQLAQQAGAQIIMERVGKGAECQIIIEEGKVSEVRP